jgi:hypothetical protein
LSNSIKKFKHLKGGGGDNTGGLRGSRRAQQGKRKQNWVNVNIWVG